MEAHGQTQGAEAGMGLRAEAGDTEAAVKLAEYRAYMCEASKRSRQKMYDGAGTGDPTAVARYERYLQVRREDYHRKKEMEATA